MEYTLSKSVSPALISKILIGQLATILDLKSREIGQNNKSKSKDQKALMQELKEVRDNLKSQLKPLIGKLNGLIMDDREIDWRGINDDLIDVSSCQCSGRGADYSLISSRLSDRRS
jgi:hypothetical protein